MNWKQLKDFCNSLDEKQLQEEVILWQEEHTICDIAALKLEDDYYASEYDEGCYPACEAEEPLEELKKVYEKGHPILWENF